MFIAVNGTVMKLSTNHTREKNAWLEALQPGYSPKGASPTFQGSPSSVTSPWRERLTPPPSKGEKQPTPPHSESSGSPPGSTQVIKSSGSVSLPISSGSPVSINSKIVWIVPCCNEIVSDLVQENECNDL